MSMVPGSVFGQFDGEGLDLETAMEQITGCFPSERQSYLLVILNGAGPNAGKTTVSGRIEIEAKL